MGMGDGGMGMGDLSSSEWLNHGRLVRRCMKHRDSTCGIVIELDDGKIYRKALYLMVKTMVSCRFSLKPIQ
jgi:hypothetical protein